MITGRRAPGRTWTEMKRHMLEVHAPMVEGHMRSAIASYVQNQVRDGRYGATAAAGRDMVAELIFPLDRIPDKVQAITDDEPNFAHQVDLFPLLTDETIVLQPPTAAGPKEPSRGFKALCYLTPRAGIRSDALVRAWHALDAAILEISGLSGYVRSTVLPNSPPLSPYKGVAGLWFSANAEAGLAEWNELLRKTGVVDEDSYFCVYVDEHRII